MSTSNPTHQAYGELQYAYDYFNAALFDGQLPPCLITLQREKLTCGYFSHRRFANVTGETIDEIAINPTYFAVVPLVEIMQTIVHEMAHLWQAHFGNPGRGRYHNAEWAAKMEAIGLMPSSTGKPGGSKTGDRMADYAMPGGKFLATCEQLLTENFRISWYDRFPSEHQVRAGATCAGLSLDSVVGGGSMPSSNPSVKESLVVKPAPGASADLSKQTRVRYFCPCNIKVWGKPKLNLICGDCNQLFSVV